MYIIEQNSDWQLVSTSSYSALHDVYIHNVGSEIVGHVTPDVIYHTSIHVRNVCRYNRITQVYTDVWCQYAVSTGLTS